MARPRRGATSADPALGRQRTIEPWVATLRARMMPRRRRPRARSTPTSRLTSSRRGAPGGRRARRPRHRACPARRDRSRDGRLHGRGRTGLAPRRSSMTSPSRTHSSRCSRPGMEPGAKPAQSARAADAWRRTRASATTRPARSCTWPTARVALHEGRHEDARAALARAHRLRPLLDHGLPWLTVQVGLELARAHLALAEPGPARTVLAETEQVLELRPHLGILVEDARELRELRRGDLGAGRRLGDEPDGRGAAPAPYLATHLTFPGIASRLFISRNTVKSEAVSIYRKLGVSSRNDAIERAVEVGLLGRARSTRAVESHPERMRRSGAGSAPMNRRDGRAQKAPSSACGSRRRAAGSERG